MAVLVIVFAFTLGGTDAYLDRSVQPKELNSNSAQPNWTPEKDHPQNLPEPSTTDSTDKLYVPRELEREAPEGQVLEQPNQSYQPAAP